MRIQTKEVPVRGETTFIFLLYKPVIETNDEPTVSNSRECNL